MCVLCATDCTFAVMEGVCSIARQRCVCVYMCMCVSVCVCVCVNICVLCSEHDRVLTGLALMSKMSHRVFSDAHQSPASSQASLSPNTCWSALQRVSG